MSVDDALARLAVTDRLLVALDFDGTLAPLIDEPMAARMSAPARAAVDALARVRATTVALVSGRTLRDLRIIAEHDDDSPLLLAGSHGAEQWPPSGSDDASTVDVALLALRDRLRARAEAIAAGVPGAWIEPKEFGFALHTRLATDSAGTRSAHDGIARLMEAEAPTWRRRDGHDILEYAFRTEGKDGAVARLRAQTEATAVLFAGDDVTDEDALRSLEPGDVGVRVGPGETAARVRVAGIPELAALLTRLAHDRDTLRE
ncbi:trehalose-phosphatase [Microbacterium sp. PM5]|uniref:trehalose-phosphatase n=1 Tax=Microbacterium sp. PM5 TaxID=2014534 RepID=UPI000DD1215B|nr:trehalose-phosphatase [Microbacterium sp. PM5]AXA95637.1 trehalose-phosphatase [Microbacterium sp. PM5]